MTGVVRAHQKNFASAAPQKRVAPALQKQRTLDRILDDVVQEASARTIFNLNNPKIRIRSNLFYKTRLDFDIGRRLL